MFCFAIAAVALPVGVDLVVTLYSQSDPCPLSISDVFISNVVPLRVTLVGLASSDMSEDASGSRRRR